MRALVLPMLLVAAPAFAQERTWTIARDVYTAEAELLAVRGDVAFLMMGDRVESVPIARLSAADQQYIASLSLAPVVPGGWEVDGDRGAGVQTEEMPLPGNYERSVLTPEFVEPESAAPIRPRSQPASRVDRSGRANPAQPGVAVNYLAPGADPQGRVDPNDRRTRRPSQQPPNNRSASSQRSANDDRPGLLGARARRIERQRAATARSR